MLISFQFLQEWKKPLGCNSAGDKDQASALLWLPACISKGPSQHAVPKGRGWVARLLGNLSLSQYPHLPPVGHCWVLGEAPQRRWCWWWARCSYAAAHAECCSGSVFSGRRGSQGLLPGSEATNKKINENINKSVFCSFTMHMLVSVCTWAVQVLYWVNIASYRAISPLCPAAAHALASRTGSVWQRKHPNSAS